MFFGHKLEFFLHKSFKGHQSKHPISKTPHGPISKTPQAKYGVFWSPKHPSQYGWGVLVTKTPQAMDKNTPNKYAGCYGYQKHPT